MKGTEGTKGMNELERFVANDRLARLLGIQVISCGNGAARARMEVGDHHLNSAGMLHGGAIFALADAAFAAASNSRGSLAVAVNASISYLKAVTGGVVTAEAEEVSLGSRLATYLIRVRDGEGSEIALFHGTVYRKKEGIAESIR